MAYYRHDKDRIDACYGELEAHYFGNTRRVLFRSNL